VYHTPLAVQPEFEFRPTPDNYRATYQGPGKLPDRIKVWRVQDSATGNVLADSLGFLDSPDTEILALGFNLGKAYGDIGICRQGSFLQWGYGDPPSQMTEAGRRLLINCIHYIRRFEGKAPLVRLRANGRRFVLLLASLITTTPEDKKEFFLRSFPAELWEKYHNDPEGLAGYYQANMELVYRDTNIYRVDEELRSLGLESNRTTQTLVRLFELRKDPAHRDIADRLLDRYTDGQTTFDFQNGRDRIYFRDVGGYKFYVVPEGYLRGPDQSTTTSPSRAQ
jgi:hypothetical protein